MPRVKRGVTARASHKKVLARAKGFRGRRNNVFRIANEAVMRAGQYAYRDRRNKKRDFRSLWIVRIGAACKAADFSYSRFMDGLKKAGFHIKGARSKEFVAINFPEWQIGIMWPDRIKMAEQNDSWFFRTPPKCWTTIFSKYFGAATQVVIHYLCSKVYYLYARIKIFCR